MTSALAGTVALVTGASSGIGEATALALANAGAAVALVARRRNRLDDLRDRIVADGATAISVDADIADRQQAEAAVARVVGELGRLDTVINNAGLMRVGPAAEADPDDWDAMLSVNVQGLLYTTRASLPYLIQAAADPAPRGGRSGEHQLDCGPSRPTRHICVYADEVRYLRVFGVGAPGGTRQSGPRRTSRTGQGGH